MEEEAPDGSKTFALEEDEMNNAAKLAEQLELVRRAGRKYGLLPSRCPLCGMNLDVETIVDQCMRCPEDQQCKHGATNPPIFTKDGFLARGAR